ncbi:hypothetical protein ABN763_02955 [Spongiivirga sp. MCCC 1A20706]|uniref:tetratricopeptide repeat protein n=1 Tax=Spongiivirga sp. MCCC 1A20706 TaxID=3160963 RepID=UPI0039773639
MKFSFVKSIALVALFCISTITSLHAQDAVSAEKYQKDLRYLQKTIHTNFPFLFKKITQEKWDTAVEKFYKEIPNLQTHEIKVGLARIVSLFEYGHTQITFSTVAEDQVLPINLYQFSDGVYIEGGDQQYQEAIGGKVLEIEGVPIKKALQMIRPVVPVENDQYFKAYGMRFVSLPTVLHAQGITKQLQNSIEFTVSKNGKTFKQQITAQPLENRSVDYCLTKPNERWVSARDQSKTPLYLKHLNEKFYFFEYLPGSKTLYVRQSSVFNDEKEPLADFYKRMFDFIDTHNVEKLVYDVRLNGGGNNYNNKTLIKGLMARPKINQQGKFFYIIGRNTFSACQNLTNEIENYTEAIRIGEPTAENKNFYGDAKWITLPNSKLRALISYAWWQDMPQWENMDWTLPHIAIEMSFEQYVKNQDPVLQAALDYTNTAFILDPLDHLTKLFMEGKFDELRSTSKEIASNPKYRYYDFEGEFTKAGTRLFEIGDTKSGLMVLGLVTETFPKSQSAWYTFGYAQEQAKMLDAAKKSYQHIIDLDPKSTLATAAKNRMNALGK